MSNKQERSAVMAGFPALPGTAAQIIIKVALVSDTMKCYHGASL